MVAALKPRGPWVMGSHGLIDINTHKGGWKLSHDANEGQKPKWMISGGEGVFELKNFNKTELIKILNEL